MIHKHYRFVSVQNNTTLKLAENVLGNVGSFVSVQNNTTLKLSLSAQ